MDVLLPQSGQRLALGAIPGSGDALVIARLATQASPRRMLVVLCADAAASQRLYEEIPFFAPDLRVHLLPGPPRRAYLTPPGCESKTEAGA